MSIKHDMETPISSLKMVINILDNQGHIDQRMMKNAENTFKRLEELLKKVEALELNKEDKQ